MGFNIGDKVNVVDDDLGGVVRSIKDDLVVIEDSDGFDREYHKSALVLVSASDQYGELDETARFMAGNEVRRDTLKKVKDVDSQLKKKFENRKAPDVDMEIDLHLHEIIDTEKGMSDADKIQYQISYFERMLEKAISDKKKKVVFIHGIGKGRLREEMRRVMNYYTNVRYFDADHRKYGSGATEVHIQHI